MATDYALTHKLSSKCGNPQQKRYYGSGNRENISRNTDDRKRQGKSTEDVGWVSKVEPLKCPKLWTLWENLAIYTTWKMVFTKISKGALIYMTTVVSLISCGHCGEFNHKSEDCRIAKNKLRKEVKPTGSIRFFPFNESENSKGVNVKPLQNRRE